MKQQDGALMASSSKRKKTRKVPPLVITCGGHDAACSAIFLRPIGHFVRDIL
jgi:hypothetical protein